MVPRLVARASAVLRCAVCHDALARWHWTCPGCNTALHLDCARRLGDCPTLGCTRRIDLPPAAPRAARAHLLATVRADVLLPLIFWVPAVLTLLWPLWFAGGVRLGEALRLTGTGFLDFDGWGVIFFGAISLGPAVGHLLLAPEAGRRGIRHQHRSATLGALTGLALSLVILAFLTWLTW